MSLMTWIVAWVVVTTAVVVLAYLRLTFGLHEVFGVKFGSPADSQFYEQQEREERKIHRLDIVGITLTVISALMALAITVVWAYRP